MLNNKRKCVIHEININMHTLFPLFLFYFIYFCLLIFFFRVPGCSGMFHVPGSIDGLDIIRAIRCSRINELQARGLKFLLQTYYVI